MRTVFRAALGFMVVMAAMVAMDQRADAEPGIGSDAAVPVVGVAADTVIEPPPGAPALGPVLPPPAVVLASLISPPLPPGLGEVQDISYGDENAVIAPVTIEFSVGPGFGGPSTGHPGAPLPPPLAFDVRTEAGAFLPPPFGDGMTASDVYQNFPAPIGGAPPCGIGANRQILDGDGAAGPPFGPPRLGLGMPEPGSNVDAYERSDETVVDTALPFGVPDLPVFFTIDAATAGMWPFPIPAPGGGAAMPGPSDILAWNPAIGGPAIYATAGALGLVPGDDIDALAVNFPPGALVPPGGIGWDFMPVGHIVFSLAAGSPSLAPTSGGTGMVPLTPACFGPGMATSADLFILFAPVGIGGAGAYIDAEQLGLATMRTGAPTDDEIDALDMCNGFEGSDIDGDLVDAACDPDMDGDGAGNGIDPDADGDGFADAPPTSHQGPANTNPAVDNCIGVWNPAQTNSDGNFVSMNPPKAYDDLTWVNSDAQGDACDTDDDNDALLDTTETSGPPCISATGPTGSTVRDTDGDRVLDGAECANGTNPNLAASFPPGAVCQAAGDGDGDGVTTSREICYYNSDPTLANTDGDTRDDGCEIASINGDLVVNVIDLQQVALSVPPTGMAGYFVNFDMNKDGFINVIDLQFVAARAGPCP